MAGVLWVRVPASSAWVLQLHLLCQHAIQDYLQVACVAPELAHEMEDDHMKALAHSKSLAHSTLEDRMKALTHHAVLAAEAALADPLEDVQEVEAAASASSPLVMSLAATSSLEAGPWELQAPTVRSHDQKYAQLEADMKEELPLRLPRTSNLEAAALRSLPGQSERSPGQCPPL